jgi:hypothetical protein
MRVGLCHNRDAACYDGGNISSIVHSDTRIERISLSQLTALVQIKCKGQHTSCVSANSLSSTAVTLQQCSTVKKAS